MNGPISVEVSDSVATVILNDPDNRNALSQGLMQQLGRALAAAVADDNVRVVVLTNAGSVFCAGADLTASGAETPSEYSLPAILEILLTSPKPVVGRIAGHCLGGGMGLAAACDISIVADDARLGFPEVRIGVAPAIVSVVCLPKISRAVALDLFLTGRRISAVEAVDVGLLTRCVSREALDASIDALIVELLAGAPGAQVTCKRLIDGLADRSRSDAFPWAEEISRELFAGPEAAAGIAAFATKSPPPWATRGERG